MSEERYADIPFDLEPDATPTEPEPPAYLDEGPSPGDVIPIDRQTGSEAPPVVGPANDLLRGMFTAGEILDASTEAPESVISGLLDVGGRLLISGSSATGKSIVAVHLAWAIAGAFKVFGRFDVPKPRKVVYLALEDRPARDDDGDVRPPYRLGQRLTWIKKGFESLNHDGMSIGSMEAAEAAAANLDFHCGAAPEKIEPWLAKVHEEHEGAVYIVDVWQCISNDDGNSRGEIEGLWRMIERATDGATIIALDHERKKSDDASRNTGGQQVTGSTRKVEAVDLLLAVLKHDSDPESDDKRVILRPDKVRDGLDMNPDGVILTMKGLPASRKLTEPAPVVLEITGDHHGITAGEKAKAQKADRVDRLVALAGETPTGVPKDAAATALDVGPRTVERYVEDDDRLYLDEGVIRVVGNG